MIRRVSFICCLLSFVVPLILQAQSHYPGQHKGKFAIEDKLKPAVYSFDLDAVRLLDSRFKQNMEREQKWLATIDTKRLLHSFRTNAGIYDANEGDTLVNNHHSFATGSNSDKEKFFKPDHQSAHLTGYTGESCNVYNMLKLSRHLFSHTADVKYADYYEKALYNHILGQQDPISISKDMLYIGS